VTLTDLISSGTVALPLDLETTYKGQKLSARIEADGPVSWNGAMYRSLSVVGGMARTSIVGAPPERGHLPTKRLDLLALPQHWRGLVLLDVLRLRHHAG